MISPTQLFANDSISSATAYLLSGEHDMGTFSSKATESLPKFRNTPIFAQRDLPEAFIANATRLLESPNNYGGDAARCFTPRHALKFTSTTRELDILLCFECLWAYFWIDGEKSIHALSEVGVAELRRFFDAAFPEFVGKSSKQILDEVGKSAS